MYNRQWLTRMSKIVHGKIKTRKSYVQWHFPDVIFTRFFVYNRRIVFASRAATRKPAEYDARQNRIIPDKVIITNYFYSSSTRLDVRNAFGTRFELSRTGSSSFFFPSAPAPIQPFEQNPTNETRPESLYIITFLLNRIVDYGHGRIYTPEWFWQYESGRVHIAWFINRYKRKKGIILYYYCRWVVEKIKKRARKPDGIRINFRSDKRCSLICISRRWLYGRTYARRSGLWMNTRKSCWYLFIITFFFFSLIQSVGYRKRKQVSSSYVNSTTVTFDIKSSIKQM